MANFTHIDTHIAMIKNSLKANKQQQESSHSGAGSVELFEIWEKADFQSNIDFIDRIIVPPGSSIGFHQHGNNEEMYVVLEGTGRMKIENEEVDVGKGDMILNPAGGRHGLTNNSNRNIDLLVIQVSINKQV